MSQVSFLPMEAIGEQGSLDLSGTRERNDVMTGYTEFFDGDVVVAKITPCFENGKGALVKGLLNGVGYGTTELHVLTPGPRLHGPFLYYITASSLFRELGQAEMTGSAGQKRVPEEFVRNYRVALPPLSQQIAISDYLDREMTRVDELIAAKQRLLCLIAEKQRATVSRAVTQGVNTDVSFRDSGVTWLGKIPAHWDMKRAKWLFTERDERSTTGEETLLSLRMEVGLVPHNDVSEKAIPSEELIGYKKTSPREIVVNRMRAASGLVAVSPQEGLVSPDYAVFAAHESVEPHFYEQLFKTELMQAVFRSASRGMGTGSSGFLRLYSEDFLDLWLPVPPLAEQRGIVAHIASEIAQLETLRRVAERTVALSRDRRGSVITAAVTGQMNLPGKA